MKVFLLCIALTHLLWSYGLSVPISTLYNLSYTECTQNAGNTNDFLACTEAEYKKQDQLLNKAYKKAKKELSSQRQKALRDMQRKWLAYRDAKCDFYYHKESGRAGLEASSSCQLDETIFRTIELRKLH